MSNLSETSKSIRESLDLPTSDAQFVLWRVRSKGPCSTEYLAVLLGRDEKYVRLLVEKMHEKLPDFNIIAESPVKHLAIVGFAKMIKAYEAEGALAAQMRTASKRSKKNSVTVNDKPTSKAKADERTQKLIGMLSEAPVDMREMTTATGLSRYTVMRKVKPWLRAGFMTSEWRHTGGRRVKGNVKNYALTEKGKLALGAREKNDT